MKITLSNIYMLFAAKQDHIRRFFKKSGDHPIRISQKSGDHPIPKHCDNRYFCEWDVEPYRVVEATCDGEPCLAKYYGCHRDREKSECSEGDFKVHFTK